MTKIVKKSTASKSGERKSLSHYQELLDISPGRVAGNSRKGDDASVEVKNKVITEICKVAKEARLSNKDIANLLAIAKTESGFNPDAASRHPRSSASGVFQITDETAGDVVSKMIKALKNEGLEQYTSRLQLETYHRFDYQSNIHHGIVVYLEKKRRVRNQAYHAAQAFARQRGQDASKIEKQSYDAISDDLESIYEKYHSGLKEKGEIKEQYHNTLKKLKEDRTRYFDALEKNLPIIVSNIDKETGIASSARVVVMQENKKGRNELFLDTSSGQQMTREEFVAYIRVGRYPAYKIVLINGLPTPVSQSDQQTENNLG